MVKLNQTCPTFLLLAAIVLTALVPSVIAHRDEGSFGGHVRQHNKMIKKSRGISGGNEGRALVFPGQDEPSSGSPSSATTTAPSTSPSEPSTQPVSSVTTTSEPPQTTSSPTTSTTSSTPTSSSTTSSSSSTSSSPSSSSQSSTTNSTTSTSSSTSTTSTSSTSSTPSTSASTSSTTSIRPTPGAPTTSGSVSTRVVVISGSTSTIPTQTPSTTPISAAKAMTVAKRTVIALIAIAGSIGLAFAIWTVIRKWKFRPSREFEDRLNGNIDWTPSGGFDDPMAEKIAAHRRNPSAGSHGSFGSSELHNQPGGQTTLSRSGSGHSSHVENNIPDLPPHDQLPPHDYIPGPEAVPGPVYNEMSRSPPDASQLHGAGGTGLSRSATMNYGEDPYGGYDDYDVHGVANVAPHHAFGSVPGSYGEQHPEPGYGVQYRGY